MDETVENKLADLFYSESNISYIENIMQDIKDGKANFSEHELIEE